MNLPQQVTSICLQWQDEEGTVPVHCTGQSPKNHQMSYRNMRIHGESSTKYEIVTTVTQIMTFCLH